MARYFYWSLIALAAGIVLAGPGIRDNAMRALWVVLGMAVILPLYFIIVRHRDRARARHLEAGE